MGNILKVFLGTGIIVFVIIILSNFNSSPSSKISPSNSLNQNNYDSYKNNPNGVPLNSLDYKKPSIEGTSCHPSYSGACLNPNASDYDCAGGSGNGPYYTGRVRVVGPDIFGLDRDRDGWGCE